MFRRNKRNVPGWRGGQDWRVVCSCQLHSRPHRLWRSATRIAARTAAVLVSIPLALAAFDIPTSAMNLGLHGTQITAPAGERTLPIFTTESLREQFLSSQRPFTLDLFKENYFRIHIPYGSVIYREARKNDLPPELVAAMVHTESDFRPRLVSHKSAQGLMQIVPETATILGIDDPFDPEKNIAAGTKYFRYLLDRFDDENVALAAYNAGEGNVARFGGVPPFAETQDYIVKVNRRTRRYREGLRSSYISTMRLRGAMN